ncbi:MAG: protease pro-enzyme activation domain-containing protein [Terracidiphilus sp.]|nr:protease pro-enzyme activation domain-containing protein [Terracidiphilus sp.]
MGAVRKYVSAAILLFAGCTALVAQTVADRVLQEINPQSTVRLAGSANPHALARNDAGRLPGGTRIAGVTLHFAPTAAQQAELDALVEAQQTPGSAYYHQWLTPEQYAARFGISDSDLVKIESWLEQQGFSIDRVSTSRTSISFSGTATQVESAFGTELHRYTVNGETHFANATALTIPAALEGVAASVRNLNDFRPKPHVRLRSAASSKVSAQFTSSQSGSHYLTPKDVATIYDVNSAYSAGYTGSGQSIAIVGQSKVYVSDIEAFQSAAGLTVKDPTLVLVPGSGTATVSSGDEAESDLDLEYSGGIAKGATIYLVYTGGNTNYSVWDSIEYAVDTRIAPIISVSYGACETELSSSDYATLEAIFKQGAAQGQSIIVSSGDDGSTSCYSDTSLTTAQREALVVSYPASSAYVTAMGGTMFSSTDSGSTNTTYWTSASGSDVISSALSYIPEVVWNNDSSSSGLSSSGGGTSTLTTRPSWQTGVTGISSAPDSSKGYRMVPDISLDSSPDNAGYLYCSSDSTSTGITGSCSNGFRDSTSTYLTVAGGTSFAAPIFAGMLAILNQKRNSDGQGLINSTLYTLASNATTYASAFHDITSGSNACTAGSSYCSTAGTSEYSATTGYDEATGLGSIDFYNLLTVWPSTTASALTGSTTTLSAATTSPSSGASDTITITVASTSSAVTTTPTGTLAIVVDGTTVNSSLALSSGSATYSFSSTTSGAHTIVATYSGDANYAASTGSVVVTIASSSTTGSGGSATSTVSVTPSGGYTGTVAFTLSTSSTYLQNYACYTLSSASVTGTSSVSKTLTVYLGTATCASVASSGKSTEAFRAASSAKASVSQPSVFDFGSVERAAFGFAGVLAAGLIGWRRRKIRLLASVFVLAALGFATTGCSSSSSSSSSSSKGISISLSPATITASAGSSGVPTGSYSLTVTGADSSSSSISSTATLTLTVN